MKRFASLKDFFLKHKWVYLAGIVFLLIVDILQLLLPEILRSFTDQLELGTLTGADLWRYSLYLLLMGLGLGVFRFFWRVCILGTSRKLEYELRNRLFSHLLTLSSNYFTHHKTGDLMAHATNDINAVRMALGMGVVMVTDAIFITVIAIGTMAVTTDLKLTLFALLPMPFLAFAMGKVGPAINNRFKGVQESFSELTNVVQENISGIRVVKSFVQEDSEIEKFNEKNQILFNKNMQMAKLFGLFFPVVQLISGLSYLVVIGYGGRLVINGTISLGDFVAFNTYLGLLIWPIMAMGYVINVMERGFASMDRINAILNETPEIVETPGAQVMPHMKGDIAFSNVTFTYPNSTQPALANFSVRIRPGESLGVIGRTGSGKTTIPLLLLRLYEIDTGQITIDGVPLAEIKLESLRQQVGYVDQDSFLFSTTLSDNIAFSLDESNQAGVEQAAKIAEIHQNILDFPQQYDTLVGERGVTLSGGQKQRVSIARALVKNPRVLILDDALSAVDTNTEERILNGLKTELQGKTSILIAHRISTIKHCDQIIVMDEGRIVEEGTHEALLERQGAYYQLYQKQLLEEKIAEE